MRNLWMFGLATILVTDLGCGGANYDPAPHIVPQSGSELCAAVCEKMQTMPRKAGSSVIGCVEAEKTVLKNGTVRTCADQCNYDQANGVSWNTGCIYNTAKTCDDVETVCGS